MSAPPNRPPPPLPPPRIAPQIVEEEVQEDLDIYVYKKPEYAYPSPPLGLSLPLFEEGYVETLFKFGKFLGCGGFSEVYQAIEISSELEYAIKIVDKVLVHEGDPNAIKNEVKILKNISHPHIVKLNQVYETPFRVYLVMEYLEQPLAAIDDRCRFMTDGVWVPPYDEDLLRTILTQLLEVLNLLHKEGIVHRDIKPENLLWIPQDKKKIKLIDFGMAVYLPKEPLIQWAGTPEFQAPEILERLPNGYDCKVDLWSLGCLIYFLVDIYHLKIIISFYWE
jgi:serine/threonine protein kinase